VLSGNFAFPSPIEYVLSGRQKQVAPIVALNGDFFHKKKESLISIGVTDVNLGSAHNLVLGLKHFKTLFKVMNGPLLA
jgi:hypothetical protein